MSVTARLEEYIGQSPDPHTTALRLDHLREDLAARTIMDSLSEQALSGLVGIVGTSNFLYHALCRHPDTMLLIGQPFVPHAPNSNEIKTFSDLRCYKYRELLKITWMDIANVCDHAEILTALSTLAENILRIAGRIAGLETIQVDNRPLGEQLGLFALGKLGAAELNFSSDVDLIFVCANIKGESGLQLQEQAFNHIRRLIRILEEQTEEGFLYRVDLNLRPWGKSGPLVLTIDDMEQYYEASTEAWERFAWLRARQVDGPKYIGDDLLKRLKPFVFHRTLGADDLQRFLRIKTDMAEARMHHGCWNVKVGAGGIRDIEFFVQILQLINGAHYPGLQDTNTLAALAALTRHGVIESEEEKPIRDAYLFLRRLENRLQIIDERQTQELPDDAGKRKFLARSLGFSGSDDEDMLAHFDNTLEKHRRVAKQYFERIRLEDHQLYET